MRFTQFKNSNFLVYTKKANALKSCVLAFLKGLHFSSWLYGVEKLGQIRVFRDVERRPQSVARGGYRGRQLA
jgi:hypothetical protein